MKVLQKSPGLTSVQRNVLPIKLIPKYGHVRLSGIYHQDTVSERQAETIILLGKLRRSFNYLSNRVFLMYLAAIEVFYIIYR